MAVCRFVLNEFAIPARPAIIMAIKLKAWFRESLDPLLAQQILTVPFPLITDPLSGTGTRLMICPHKPVSTCRYLIINDPVKLPT